MPKKLFFFALILLLLASLFPASVHAAISACSVTVAPQSYDTGVPGVLTFGITNNDDSGDSIRWIKITSPSTDFVISSGTGTYQSSSSVNGSGSEIITELTGLPQGEYGEYYITVTTGDTVIAAKSFAVQVSDTVGGDNPISCTGDTNVSITSAGQEVVKITNTSVSLTDTTATISWNTGLSTTAQLVYGKTSSYGSSAVDSSLATSHTINLTGLSANTLYHFKIYSTDSNSNVAQLVDNTFTTNSAGATTTVTTTVTNTVTSTVIKTQKDTTSPTIRFKNKFKKIYEESPLVESISSDDTGISRIEYSIDSGSNWSNLDLKNKIGEKQISSNFTPNIVDDGDYSLYIRATDTAGNKMLSKEIKFTIDRLAPRVGPLIVMAGPIVVQNNISDYKDLLVGIEYKFILSAAGGPNKVEMNCGDNTYKFNKNVNTGVWVAKIKFDSAFQCLPKITATDGAGNIGNFDGSKLIVNDLGHLSNGTITIYWYDDYEKKFIIWNGAPYGETNPIETRYSGGYGLVLPSGRYYLEAKSIGKRTMISNIINATDPVFINDDWNLNPAWKFWSPSEEKIINPKLLGNNEWKEVNFDLPNVNLGSISTLDIRGSLALVSLITSWHPETNNLLKNLDELYKNKIGVYPILVQEKESIAKLVKRRGGYETPIFADKDGDILKVGNINDLPVTWIVNRYGVVIMQKTGILDSQEVIEVISKTE